MTRLRLLSNGEPVGTLDVQARAEGRFDVDYWVDNNGRGAKLTETLTLDSAGLPVSWAIDGTSMMGGAVAERFRRDADGTARWSSQADLGSEAAPGFYFPADASPYALAVLVDHALATGAAVPLLPTGAATVTPVEIDLDLGEPAEVFAITGVMLREQYVVRRLDGTVLAIADTELLVTDDLIPDAVRIGEALQRVTLDRFAEISRAATVHTHGTLIIRGAQVFDPTSRRLSPPKTIVVRNDRIAAIGDSDLAVEDDKATIIDAAGLVAVPGLHDMHAHLDPSSALLYIAAGVTTVRDMGNDNAKLQSLTAAISAGELAGPTAVPAGFIEGRSPYAMRLGRVVDSLGEALEAVDWYADHGYHAIKIYNSFDPEWVRATAARAHQRGLRVQGHIPAFMDADRAIADGYDEITHLNQLALGWVLAPDEDTRTPLRLTALTRVAELDLDSEPVQHTMRAMAERSIGLDTTLVILEQLMLSRARTVIAPHEPIIDHLPVGYQRYRKRTYVPYQDASELTTYEAAFTRLLEITSRLHQLGVPLWPGTDDGTGSTVHRELELYVEAGIPPTETLQIATTTCAAHLGRGETHGILEPGRVADIVLIDGDPTTDISSIRKVALTIAAGRAIVPARIYQAFGITPWAETPPVHPT